MSTSNFAMLLAQDNIRDLEVGCASKEIQERECHAAMNKEWISRWMGQVLELYTWVSSSMSVGSPRIPLQLL